MAKSGTPALALFNAEIASVRALRERLFAAARVLSAEPQSLPKRGKN